MFKPLWGSNEEPTAVGLIGQGLGYASMCWEEIEKAGTFQSHRLDGVAQAIQDEVRAMITGRLVGLMDNQNTAREWNEAIEAAICAVEGLK